MKTNFCNLRHERIHAYIDTNEEVEHNKTVDNSQKATWKDRHSRKLQVAKIEKKLCQNK